MTFQGLALKIIPRKPFSSREGKAASWSPPTPHPGNKDCLWSRFEGNYAECSTTYKWAFHTHEHKCSTARYFPNWLYSTLLSLDHYKTWFQNIPMIEKSISCEDMKNVL